MKSRKDIFWVSLLSIICVVCFPLNPLVLTGILGVKSYTVTTILGWIVWAFGMVLVVSPMVLFPRRGGVPKNKSFVRTTRLVDSGIYSILRHPQYTGGIYAIFLATLLMYPHWLFALLGAAGTILIVQSVKTEDGILVEKFGDAYAEYMEKVPATNFVAGIYRLMKRRRKQPRTPD